MKRQAVPKQAALLLLVLFFILGCTNKAAEEKMLMATTTSMDDSGLLDYLLPDFQAKYDIEVEVISVGSGQALKNGERGDVDVVLVHDPAGEAAFVKNGFGIDRRCVMYNDFIILGPASDPAGIKGSSLEDALTKISSTGALFISRGDDSGTNKKELQLWKVFNIDVNLSGWYEESGAGMADTLRIADEKQAYTLSDRGTYISLNDTLSLVTLVQGDDILLNPYGVIRVNPEVNKRVNAGAAKMFEDWIMSEATQGMIGGFQKNGEALFHPLRGECIGG